MGVYRGGSAGDGPFKRVARSVALLLIGLAVLRSKDADSDTVARGVGEVPGSSMRDKDWGGDWVIGEFKTASLTGSNFPGIVGTAGWGTSTRGPREKGRFYDRPRVRGDRSTVGLSSRVEDGLSSVVVSDGGEAAAALRARRRAGGT